MKSYCETCIVLLFFVDPKRQSPKFRYNLKFILFYIIIVSGFTAVDYLPFISKPH